MHVDQLVDPEIRDHSEHQETPDLPDHWVFSDHEET